MESYRLVVLLDVEVDVAAAVCGDADAANDVSGMVAADKINAAAFDEAAGTDICAEDMEDAGDAATSWTGSDSAWQCDDAVEKVDEVDNRGRYVVVVPTNVDYEAERGCFEVVDEWVNRRGFVCQFQLLSAP